VLGIDGSASVDIGLSSQELWGTGHREGEESRLMARKRAARSQEADETGTLIGDQR
jgi:hypothetical protein